MAYGRDLHRPEESSPHPGKILINKDHSGPRYSQHVQLLVPLCHALRGLPVLHLSADFYFVVPYLATPEPVGKYVAEECFDPLLAQTYVLRLLQPSTEKPGMVSFSSDRERMADS